MWSLGVAVPFVVTSSSTESAATRTSQGPSLLPSGSKIVTLLAARVISSGCSSGFGSAPRGTERFLRSRTAVRYHG